MIAPRRHPSSRPFLAAPRVEFYHPAQGIDAAVHGLDRAIRRAEGIGLVVGPPGTGKSLLLAKVAESVRDDFDVAMLSGARICTRRALWQAILAGIGEPYRGIEEGELRIGVVERIRGLAAAGSGLVVLVDEAPTLPTRLIEELRLLTNIPTPLPAVHVVLCGTAELEEILAAARMESLAQRIGARFYLEPLDHAETILYVRTQMKSAGMEWEAVFERACDDAVFTVTDGVPRLINQVCDMALVHLAEKGGRRVMPGDIARAWREIQRLPAPASLGQLEEEPSSPPSASEVVVDSHWHDGHDAAGERIDAGLTRLAGDAGIVEFGSFESAGLEEGHGDDTLLEEADAPDAWLPRVSHPSVAERDLPRPAQPAADPCPWRGPDVELVFDPAADPFADYFADQERTVERCVVRGPSDFGGRRHVSSREGATLGGQLHAIPEPAADQAPLLAAARVSDDVPTDADDADMVVIEEDLCEPNGAAGRSVFPVRVGDYRSLFARLRRGESSR